MSADPAELMAQAALQDDALHQRIIDLANRSLDHAEFIMEHGDPRVKAQITRQFLTIFARQLTAKEANEEIEELKRAVQELAQSVSGYTPGGEDGELVEEPIAVDGL